MRERREKLEMEKVKEMLSANEEHEDEVLGLEVRPHRPWVHGSFYEGFFLRGIRVDRIRPGFLSCSFKVPARLTDMSGNLSAGAIGCLVDKVGFSSIYADGQPWKITADMSVSYMSTARVDDELEITSRLLGYKGGCAVTHVVLKNKRTGEIVAEGRHSLFGLGKSKI